MELAARLGLWRPTLSDIENGRLEISDEQFRTIIAAIRELSQERASAEPAAEVSRRQGRKGQTAPPVQRKLREGPEGRPS